MRKYSTSHANVVYASCNVLGSVVILWRSQRAVNNNSKSSVVPSNDTLHTCGVNSLNTQDTNMRPFDPINKLGRIFVIADTLVRAALSV
jgi:hypothetical protein